MNAENPTDYKRAMLLPNGHVTGPECHGQPMKDVGGCCEGCCDDYQCEICGFQARIKWPD